MRLIHNSVDTVEHDEKIAFTFAVSTLASSTAEQLLQCGMLYIPPLSLLNPKGIETDVGRQICFWCAEQKAGVGAMRDCKSDLPLDV